jgi:hypothetical protein
VVPEVVPFGDALLLFSPACAQLTATAVMTSLRTILAKRRQMVRDDFMVGFKFELKFPAYPRNPIARSQKVLSSFELVSGKVPR